MSNAEVNWVPDASTFGARLALVRWKMRWNVREAERECNVSQNTWAGWEAGKKPRNILEVASSIVWATKVDRDWLLFGAGHPEGDGSHLGESNSRPIHYSDAPVVSLDAFRTGHASRVYASRTVNV